MEFHRIWSEGEENPEVIIISFGAEWQMTHKYRIFRINEKQEEDLIDILAIIRNAFVMEKRAVCVCRQGMESVQQIAVNRFEMLLLSYPFLDLWVS